MLLAANSFTRITNFLTRLGRGASQLYRVSVNESLQHLQSSGVGIGFLSKVTSSTARQTTNATSITKN